MNRRGLLKSLLVAPAAIVFNKTGEAEEKVKYASDDIEYYELKTQWISNQSSGIFHTGELSESDFRLITGSGIIPRYSG